MGEIKSSDILTIFKGSRRYMLKLLDKESLPETGIVLFIIVLAQLLYVQYAASMAFISPCAVYKVTPQSIERTVADRYKKIASSVIRRRNVLCHALGTAESAMLITRCKQDMYLLKALAEDLCNMKISA